MEDGVAGNIGPAWIVVLLILEAILYGFYTAITNSKESCTEEDEREETKENAARKRKLEYLMKHQIHFFVAMKMGLFGIAILLGAFFFLRLDSFLQIVTYRWIQGKADQVVFAIVPIVTVVIAILVFLYIIIGFCVYLPKKMAEKSPGKWVSVLITPMTMYMRIVMPFAYLIVTTVNGILRLFGIKNTDAKTDVSEEEILSIVNVGHEQGVLQASEAEMINNIIEYGDKEAKDIMINRNNMVAMDCQMTLTEAAEFIANAHNSRFPVYDGTIDNIVGILHLKDVMRIQMNEKMKGKAIGKIKGLLMEPTFITEKRKIDELLRLMQTEKIQMVIVIDEYGQTAGLVALEDILEEIVGKIEDEYDEEASYISTKGQNSYEIQGMTPLEELEEQLGISFEDEPFDTVNGFVISYLEHIPEENEEFEFVYEGFTFSIQSVKDRMIQTVIARKNPEASENMQDGDVE